MIDFEDLRPGMILWPEREDLKNSVAIITKAGNEANILIFYKEKYQFIGKKLIKDEWLSLRYNNLETELKFVPDQWSQRKIIKDFFEFVGDFL